jgi:serine/threonine protein kinase
MTFYNKYRRCLTFLKLNEIFIYLKLQKEKIAHLPFSLDTPLYTFYILDFTREYMLFSEFLKSNNKTTRSNKSTEQEDTTNQINTIVVDTRIIKIDYQKKTLLNKYKELLQTFHDKNIIHNDIKPNNLLLSKDLEKVLFFDFDISICNETIDIINDIYKNLPKRLKYFPEFTKFFSLKFYYPFLNPGNYNMDILKKHDRLALDLCFYPEIQNIIQNNKQFPFLDIIQFVREDETLKETYSDIITDFDNTISSNSSQSPPISSNSSQSPPISSNSSQKYVHKGPTLRKPLGLSIPTQQEKPLQNEFKNRLKNLIQNFHHSSNNGK